MRTTTSKTLAILIPTIVVILGVPGAVVAEDLRFAEPVPATLRTKSNTLITGTWEGLSRRVVLFRSSRGRQLKLSNFQIRYVRTNDGEIFYRPSINGYTSILRKAKALNEKLKQAAANRPANPPANNGATNGTPGNNSEPPPTSRPDMGGATPPGMMPGSRFPMPGAGSRFGRTGRVGGIPRFPRSRQRSGFPGGGTIPGSAGGMPGGGTIPGNAGGMPPGAEPLPGGDAAGGMPPGGLPQGGDLSGMPPGSTIPGTNRSRFGGGTAYAPAGSPGAGTMPGSQPGSSMPGSSYPGGSFNQPGNPGSNMPSSGSPSYPDIQTGSSSSQKVCSGCNQVVPSHVTAGDRCPHCGVRFDYDETNGKRAPLTIGGGIVGGIVLLGLIGFVIRKMTE